MCTEAADHPQHYGKDGCSLGADHSQALTLLKTVAFRSAVSMDGIAKQQHARRSNNELVSEVVPKALISFVQNGIRCQQRP